MRLVCPDCEAAYDVPDRLIGSGRRVRCVRCGHDWLPGGDNAGEAEPPAPPPVAPAVQPMVEPKVEPAAEGPVEPEPAEAIADATPPPQRNPALALAWMASVLLLLGLFGAGWLYREEIAVAWPPAQRVLVLIEPARG